ncbi:bridge-like lipid transfer protein family member 3B [Saccoglossus kowalevskii]|uniref:UHRF1-binding protein 1-like n=1 Tax=Saccoglossus kowalevskii TaxID=10224 RepID=A0ABM0M886_SACKO|nr:PREDICTED: UHRF1-binding protein 1-like [Saccoglossus kowalevskii]
MSTSDRYGKAAQLRGSVSLFVLLGITWALAILAISEAGLVVNYLFAIANSLQGLIIFIFFCALRKDVQKEWRDAFCSRCQRSSRSAEFSKMLLHPKLSNNESSNSAILISPAQKPNCQVVNDRLMLPAKMFSNLIHGRQMHMNFDRLRKLQMFAKNLSPDKIKLSTLKGEGDLQNLELDEKVLMDIMDLPTWVILTKAVCNKVSIKIPWTKLKTHPATLYLDQVEIEMEISDNLRHPNDYIPLHSSGGKYGFSDRVIDGLYVVVNAVNINFHSKAFQASAQISRFRIRSTSPMWQPSDLRLTRIKDSNRDEILIFKEADWSTLRIEIDAIKKDPERPTTPIRLITNQGKIRFTIKKRLSDCVMLTSKVQLLLEDLLWVLTDSQLKAFIEYLQFLGALQKQSENEVKTSTNIQSQAKMIAEQAKGKQSQATQHQHLSAEDLAMTRFFDKFDVVETSYHLTMHRVDLHLCDEQNRPQSEESFRRRTDGGAMQITLQKFSLDLYPYHIANTSRAHWERFDDAMSARDCWVEHLMAHFKQQVNNAREGGRPFKSQPRPHTEDRGHQVRGHSIPQTKSKKQARLLENTLVLRLEDFSIYAVSTTQSSHKAPSKKFLSSDKKALFLPPEISSLHVEYTSYYFPEGLDFPVPQANVFVKLNPLQLTLDIPTILWLSQFASHMATGVKDDGGPVIEFEHRDIRIDALMPKFVLPAEPEVLHQPDRPKSLQIQSSQITISNCRSATNSTKSDLGSTLQNMYSGKLFCERKSYPGDKNDLNGVPKMFWNHAYDDKKPRNPKHCAESDKYSAKVCENGAVPAMLDQAARNQSECDDPTQQRHSNGLEHSEGSPLHSKSFATYASEDIWCVNFDQVWLEFLGAESTKGRPVSLLEAIPLSIWVCFPKNSKSYREKSNKAKIANPGDTILSKHSITAIQEMDRVQRRKLLHEYYKSKSSTESSMDSSIASPEASAAYPFSRSQSDSVFLNSLTEREPDPRDCYSDSKGSPPPPRYVHYSTSTDSSSSTFADFLTGPETNVHGGEQEEEPSAADDSEESYIADRCIIVHSDSKARFMLNHYQLLFLLRLIDSFSAMMVVLEEDYVMFFKQPSQVKSMMISLRLQQVELTLLMPPLPDVGEDEFKDGLNLDGSKKEMQLLSVETSGVPSDSVTSHDSGLGTPTTETGKSDLEVKQNSEGTVHVDDGNELMSEMSEGGILVEESSASGGIAEDLKITDEPKVEFRKVNRDFVTLQVGSPSKKNELLNSLPKYDTPLGSKGDINYIQLQKLKGSGLVKSPKSSSFAGLSSSLSESQVSLDEISSLDSSSHWDTLSVSSDTSDPFVVLGGGVPSISGDGESDASCGSENVPQIVTNLSSDRTSSRASTPSIAGSCVTDRKQRNVSIVIANLRDFQIALEFNGDNSTIKLLLHDIELEEKRNHDMDYFISKRIADGSSKIKSAPPLEASKVENPVVSVRLSMGPSAEKYCAGVGDRSHLDVRVDQLNTKVSLSTVTNLLSLIEDELLGPCMPMDIKITKADIKLISDSPPVYPLCHLQSDEPLILYLQSAIVKRTLDGVFHINAIESKDKDLEDLVPQSEEVADLQTHNKRLKEQLEMTRTALANVEHERLSLTTSLTRLQQELITVEREKDSLKVKVDKLKSTLLKR